MGGRGVGREKEAETATAGDDRVTNQPILRLPRLDHGLKLADLSAAEMGICSEWEQGEGHSWLGKRWGGDV
jgi:hypothetical protein